MARLRLTLTPLDEPAQRDDVLLFPAQALAEARARVAAPNLRAGLPARTRDLVTRVDAMLDDLQRGLDGLRDQVENYRFPGLPPPDDRKPAA